MQNQTFLTSLCRKILGTVCSVFMLAAVFGLSAEAKEITVSEGNIQAALDEAKTAGEEVIVTIPAGKYTLDSFLLVYSNTTINADGAEIHGNATTPVLINQGNAIEKLTINGGTWVGNDMSAFQFFGAKDLTLKNLTVSTDDEMWAFSVAMSGGENVTFQDVTIGAGKSGAIAFDTCKNVSFINVDFKGDVPYVDTENENVTFKKCTFNHYNVYGTAGDKNFTYEECSGIASVILSSGNTGYRIINNRLNNGSGNAIVTLADNTVITGNVITGFGGSGIVAEDASNLTISDNKVENVGDIGIAVRRTANNTITGNSVISSGKTGMSIEEDTDSTVKANEIDKSATLGVSGSHGEGLVIIKCTGTQVLDNIVSNTYSKVANNGNGIIVAESSGVTVDGNNVSDSGNHGIQVSYASKNTMVSNNTIVSSGRMGFSVSRGSTDIVFQNNTVSASAVNGITFDGQEGTVTGSILNCTVTDSKEQGILLSKASVTVNENRIQNNGIFGVTASESTLTANGNVIFRDTVLEGSHGIRVINGSAATLESNVLGNFGECGISVMDGNTVTASNNTVSMNGTAGSSKNAYLNLSADDSGLYNSQMMVESLGVSKATGQTYFENVEAGVVIADVKISTRTDGGGAFSVEYGAQADTSGIIVYMMDEMGNAICLNAPADFDVHKVGASGIAPTPAPGDGQEADLEQIKAFVTRLYQTTLGREPGLAPDGTNEADTWVNLLAEKTLTGAQVAQGFFFSVEFLSKNYSGEEYVDALYRAMFDSTGDAEGRALWIGEMERGMSRNFIFYGFAESVQFKALCESFGIISGTVELIEPRDQNRGVTAFVARNYVKALGRDYEVTGLNFWCQAILNGMAPEKVVWSFVFSQEFIDKNLSNEEFVKTLYATYFDTSQPDEAGFNMWVGMLNNGESRETIVNGFSGSQQFMNLVASFNLPQ